MRNAVRRGIAASVALSIAFGNALSAATPAKVVIIIAQNDFQEDELETPKRVLETNGYRVAVASRSPHEAVGMRGSRVMPDMTIDILDVEDYAGVIFAGGSGASEYWDDPVAYAIARETVRAGKVLGAICFGPVTLANAGVLKGKAATVWPSEASRLEAGGALYRKTAVQVDGTIVTADGPSSANEFALAFLEALSRNAPDSAKK